MASWTHLLFALVFLAAVAAPAAQAQLLGLIHINGIVHCSVGAATSATPVFPSALVQLKCGKNVNSSATTNSNGVFDIELNLLDSVVSTLLTKCTLVVRTPLAACNASLPTSGLLHSDLKLLISGNVAPVGFALVQSLV